MRPWTLFLLALILTPSAVYASDTRDWKLHPAIVEITPAPGDIYAVGDIHADYDRFASLLVGAKLIAVVPESPEKAQWAGGKAVLICTGNVIAGYNQSLQVVSLLRTLQKQAAEAGGKVVVTLGEDEATFLATKGNGTKAVAFVNELKAAKMAPADVAAGTDAAGIGQWLAELPVAAKAGDWFFSAAGDTDGKRLAALESDFQKQISDAGYSAPIIKSPTSLIAAPLTPHPWWEPKDLTAKANALEAEQQNDQAKIASDRSVKGKAARAANQNAAKAQQDEKKVATELAALKKQALGEKILQTDAQGLGVKHMVIGHESAKVTFADNTYREAGHVYTEFKGLVYLIDTGLSRGGTTGGKPALLHIQAGHPAAVYADGTHAGLP